MSENMMSEASKTHPMICTTISTLQMLSEQGEDTVSDLLTDHATISGIIKYMQKFQRADWLRARQLIPNSAES